MALVHLLSINSLKGGFYQYVTLSHDPLRTLWRNSHTGRDTCVSRPFVRGLSNVGRDKSSIHDHFEFFLWFLCMSIWELILILILVIPFVEYHFMISICKGNHLVSVTSDASWGHPATHARSSGKFQPLDFSGQVIIGNCEEPRAKMPRNWAEFEKDLRIINTRSIKECRLPSYESIDFLASITTWCHLMATPTWT